MENGLRRIISRRLNRNNSMYNRLQILVLFISVFCFSCNEDQKSNDQWKKYCNKTYYEINFNKGEIQEKELMAVFKKLEVRNFEGNLVFKGDSLKYGWHNVKLKNQNAIVEVLKENGFYALYYRKEWVYLKKVAGFIDDNCGIMYVPTEESMPVQVTKSRCLRNSSFGQGSWYFVETKL